MTHIYFGTPSISERLKLDTCNFVCISVAGSPNQNYAIVGHRGSGSRDLLIFQLKV